VCAQMFNGTTSCPNLCLKKESLMKNSEKVSTKKEGKIQAAYSGKFA